MDESKICPLCGEGTLTDMIIYLWVLHYRSGLCEYTDKLQGVELDKDYFQIGVDRIKALGVEPTIV